MKITKAILLIITIASLLLVLNTDSSLAGNLTSVKDTLSTSQLSYFGRMGTGVATSQSIAKVDVVTATNPSKTTANLFVGDTISIGSTNGSSENILTDYRVIDVGNTAEFSVNPSLAGQDNLAGQAIVATRSAVHTVAFTATQVIPNGKFQFLIKTPSGRISGGVGRTDANGELNNNGIPDQFGFDSGADVGATIGLGTAVKAEDVACPISGTASIGTTIVIGTGTFHIYECTYAGSNAAIGYTMVVGRALSSGSQLINPSPGVNHVEGSTQNPITAETTDIYSFYIRHLNGTTVVDQTQGRVAVIEAVKITATVDPTLTFNIDTYLGTGTTGVGNLTIGTTNICGSTLASGQESTTGGVVRFGSLLINSYKTLAQRLSVVTNASNGYVLTAFQDKYMTAVGITAVSGAGITIPNTKCDGGTCTISSPQEWNAISSAGAGYSGYGLGYSLHNIDGGTGIMNFNYNDSSRSFNSKPFGFGSANIATIMSEPSTPQQTDRAYVCYRIGISPQQTAGDYESRVIYTATSTF